MSLFKCKMCGGTIEFEQGATVGVCDSCGTRQTLPRLDDDRRANLYDRANHFRRNNDFDKAAGIYEQILNEDNTDAEAYWSLVLCRYGIEYVEDPATRKRVPTVNRAQFTSIFDDDNYKSAVQYADGYQRELYEKEAKTINDIQKGILAISQKEEPFDVFICYKETDNNGRRTQDSVLANELYHQLTQEGFKVFFSRITLEDKLGSAYEPYIFAALNSAKVMVVLGTKPEYFNAVWVKNEWSRYLALVKKSGGKKVLIPAYRDMDPYDLPEEFSHLQAQDMSKLGFMQDLIRGIKKIAKADEPKETAKETVVVSGNTNIAPLIKRAFIFLEDGNWAEADEYCEKVLDQDPENAEAYVGKLMAELQVRKQDDLANCEQPFDNSNNYQKALRFGGDKTAAAIKGYITHINERNENARLSNIYNGAVSSMNTANTEEKFKRAAEIFRTVPGFKDADELSKQCLERAETCRKDKIYAYAKSRMTGIRYEEAIQEFSMISGWKDADEQINICQRKIEELKAKEEDNRRERERQAEQWRIEAEKRSKRNKKTAAIVIPVIAVIIIIVILIPTVIIPTVKYNNAVRLYNAEKYDEAIAAFTELNGYKDSNEQITICSNAIKEKKYNSAVDLYNAGKYNEAMAAFSALFEYRESSDYVKKCEDAIKDQKYNAAMELYNSGNYKEALTSFQTMGDYKGSNEKYNECCLKMSEISFSEKNYERAVSYYEMQLAYDVNGEEYRKLCYNCATELLNNDILQRAIEFFEKSKNYENAENQIISAKYKYIQKHKTNNDMKTYEYLSELKALNYADTAELFKELYAWKAELVCFNTDKDDNTTILDSISKSEDYLHFSVKITGGEPNSSITLIHTSKYPGYNATTSDWAWEETKPGDSIGAEWSSGFLSQYTGELIITIKIKSSREIIGEFSINITE